MSQLFSLLIKTIATLSMLLLTTSALAQALPNPYRAVDNEGNMYGGESSTQKLQKYVRVRR